MFEIVPNGADIARLQKLTNMYGSEVKKQLRKSVGKDARAMRKKVATIAYKGGTGGVSATKGKKNPSTAKYGHVHQSLQAKFGVRTKKSMGYYQRINFKWGKKGYVGYFLERGTKMRRWKSGKSTGVLPAFHPFENAAKQIEPDIKASKNNTADIMKKTMEKLARG
ncbi:MAG: hypothetical protein GY847_14210 [Proteobacteria bacterium]|nr:hypothetical protein [Pseudomonadota bacterium]